MAHARFLRAPRLARGIPGTTIAENQLESERRGVTEPPPSVMASAAKPSSGDTPGLAKTRQRRIRPTSRTAKQIVAQRCEPAAFLVSPRQRAIEHVLKAPCVYIMANKRNGTLYTGVTASLELRAFQHREGTGSAFAKRYGCTRLVWYERYERMDEAIAREKEIKGGSRAKKLALIDIMNPDWADLYDSLAH
jgi:putative endonuclease